MNADHVREWRKKNPNYWRRLHPLSRCPALAAVLRDLALQDSIDTHFALVIGLIAHVTNHSLQDTIAFEVRRLILLGYGILRPSPQADSKET